MKSKHQTVKQIAEYTVTIHAAQEGGFWAEAPALPGCFSQGETIEETLKNTREAIEAHLQALNKEGAEIPMDRDIIIGRVSVAAMI